MKREKILLTILFFCVSISAGGCVIAAIGAGAGTVAYVRGDLEVIESASLSKVYRAAEKAVQELELNVISKQKDVLSATIEMRDAQDKKIVIKLKATAENTTKISIRIGLFGDEAKSRMIYNKIKENL